jgi:hypothetical protein
LLLKFKISSARATDLPRIKSATKRAFCAEIAAPRNFAVTSYGSDTMNIAKKIFDTAELLQISINAVWLVNKTEKYAFRRKELP